MCRYRCPKPQTAAGQARGPGSRPGSFYDKPVVCRQLPFRAAGAVSEWCVTREQVRELHITIWACEPALVAVLSSRGVECALHG
jgi:hypothetical protein